MRPAAPANLSFCVHHDDGHCGADDVSRAGRRTLQLVDG
jgi:hypothetical protein